MPLSLTLIVRPSRAAVIAVLAAVVCLVATFAAVAGAAWVQATAQAVALVATVYATGLLAPIHGRGARTALRVARGGILVAATGVLLTEILRSPGLVLVVVGVLVAVVGLRLLARASRAEGELPQWAYAGVLAGVGATALLGPVGILVLVFFWLGVSWTIRASTRRLHAPVAVAT